MVVDNVLVVIGDNVGCDDGDGCLWLIVVVEVVAPLTMVVVAAKECVKVDDVLLVPGSWLWC